MRILLISNNTGLVTSGVCVCDDLFKLYTLMKFCVYILVICEQHCASLHILCDCAFT